MLGGIGDRRRRGWQRMRWLDGITDLMDVSLGELGSWWWTREAWHAAIHGVTKSQTRLSNWTELNWCSICVDNNLDYTWTSQMSNMLCLQWRTCFKKKDISYSKLCLLNERPFLRYILIYTPLQYSCLENPMDRGAWWAAVHGVAKSWTRLSDFTFTFPVPALGKEMATHSSVIAWRVPGMREPGGLPSMGSHRVGHDWSNLAAAAAVTKLVAFLCVRIENWCNEAQHWKIIKQQRWRKSIKLGLGGITHTKNEIGVKLDFSKVTLNQEEWWKAFKDHMKIILM